MHPSTHAENRPDHLAYIMGGTGLAVTYRELDDRSNQAAHLLRSLGMRQQDVMAILMDNNPRFFDIAWAAQRSGLYYVAISAKLSANEIDYIVRDSGAKALVASSSIGTSLAELPPLLGDVALFVAGGPVPGFRSYEDECAAFPATPISIRDRDPKQTLSFKRYGLVVSGRARAPSRNSATRASLISSGLFGPFGLNQSGIQAMLPSKSRRSSLADISPRRSPDSTASSITPCQRRANARGASSVWACNSGETCL